jgi:hypothetical protein
VAQVTEQVAPPQVSEHEVEPDPPEEQDPLLLLGPGF